jgi:hypothetical protein
MNLVEDFQKHAVDCEQMARSTRDSASKAAWRELAARFRQRGEGISKQSLAIHDRQSGGVVETAVNH